MEHLKQVRPKVSVGYYDDSASRGGTTRYLTELLGAIDRRRFHPVFFAPQPQPWHADLCSLNVEVITLGPRMSPVALPSSATEPPPPLQRRRSPMRLPQTVAWTLGTVREMLRLESLFRMRPVDLLHSNNAGAEVAPIAARLAGCPRVLATWHVDSTYDLGRRSSVRYRLLERLCMQALQHSIAISHATKQDWVRRCRLSAKSARNVTVVHNGISMERVQRHHSQQEARSALNLPQDALLVGSLGRLDEMKGYEYLLRALPAVIAIAPRVQLAMAGSGPLEAHLRSLAQQLGVANHVHFLGFISDVCGMLECLDIYVQPSLCEAHGIALLEAGGIGLPLIVSAIGGMPETVIDGETGYVVPPRDSQALASSLLKLVHDSDLRVRMSERGREVVLKNFTCDQMLTKTVEVYDRILKSR